MVDLVLIQDSSKDRLSKIALIPSLGDRTSMESYFVWKVRTSMLASGLGGAQNLLRDQTK